MERFKAAKPAIEMRQADLLADRYDLSNRAVAGYLWLSNRTRQVFETDAGTALKPVAPRRILQRDDHVRPTT
jgi:hypothetical protein